MEKETGNILRLLALCALFLAICAAALFRIRTLERQIDALTNAPADTVTVIRHDTVKIDSPVPVHHYTKLNDTVYIVLTDVKTDTVKELVYLPREFMVYKDTSYRAVVSGVQPRLDSIEIYQHNVVQTVTKTVKVPDSRRWGFGIQAGAGWDGKRVRPFVGAGIQYSVFRW